MTESDSDRQKSDPKAFRYTPEALLQAVKAMGQPTFAAMDGARFADLPATLRRHGLAHRCLFLDHADKDVERMGGWIVPIRQGADAELIVETMAGMPAAVFWSCPDGEPSLYRHLRTLNLVVVPLPVAKPADGEAGQGDQKPTAQRESLREETVMFRHCDPNVMASLLPILDTEQFARVFGPATEIIVQAPDYYGLRRAPRPDDLPLSPSGLLRIRPDQMQALEDVKIEASRRKIARYLRAVCPSETATLDDRQIYALVLDSERIGCLYGLSSQRAHGYWAYLMLTSEGRIARSSGVTSYLRQQEVGGTADEKIFDLMDRLGRHPALG